MKDNHVLMIVLAFVLGYTASGKNICDTGSVEGMGKTTYSIAKWISFALGFIVTMLFSKFFGEEDSYSGSAFFISGGVIFLFWKYIMFTDDDRRYMTGE